MRSRLTEILTDMDTYNGIEDYNSDEVNIHTQMPNPPTHATISEGMKSLIKGVLLKEGAKKPKKWEGNHVMSFESFTNSNIHSNFQKFPPQDPDYDQRPEGWNDEEEEE